MCGRFTITADHVDLLLKKFGAVKSPVADHYQARYNAAPGQIVPALVTNNEGIRYLTGVFWGIATPWNEEKENEFQANIRDDTLVRNAFFRKRLLEHRCGFIADGFYEWKKPAEFAGLKRGERLPRGVKKTPYRIVMKSREPFLLAGVWRTITSGDRQLVSAAIITTSPNKLMAPIHDRMPVIIPPDGIDYWLDPSEKNIDSLKGFLSPFPAAEMEAYPVSTLVNNSRTDTPACIDPAPRS